jgi:low temperature requirement protein LtrA
MSEAAGPDEAPDRIEWLELFFDLVVVAAVAVLSEGLRDHPTYSGLGMFLVSYTAVWFAWTNVVMYADVAGELTRVRTVVVSMFLVALMAAAAPGHDHVRPNAFAVAFILVRLFASRGALRTGRLMVEWPLLEFGGFSVPWIVSLWVDAPLKYWLWALGLFVDLAMVAVRGTEMADRQLERWQSRLDRARDSHGRTRGGRSRGGEVRDVPDMEQVGVHVSHLDERLGLFVIIVLGESVAALVLAAARVPWTHHFVWTVLAAFVLLVMLWLLTFSYGFAAAPGVRLGALPPRFGLPLHLLTTLGILLLGVGLGEAVAVPEELPDFLVWTTCAGLSLYAVASAGAGLLGGAVRFWLYSCAIPTIAYPLVLAAVATGLPEGLPVPLLIWLLALPAGWQFLYAQRHSALTEHGIIPSPETS